MSEVDGVKAINKVTFGQRLKAYKRSKLSFLLAVLVLLSAIITIGVLGYLIFYILIKGVPNLSPDLFSLTYTSENVSMIPAIINTLIMTILALLIAVPLGIFSAISSVIPYVGPIVVSVTTETLAGIPSIVYGLFGMLFFVTYCHWKYSILAGAFTLSIMILPSIMRTTQEALLSVPDSFREGSYGLGAGKLRTVFRIVLPSAIPGILAGIILAIGRIVGETAALIFTAGTVPDIAKNLMSSGRTLAVHMYVLSGEGLHTDQAYATAVVLLVVVIIINGLSTLIAKKFTKA